MGSYEIYEEKRIFVDKPCCLNTGHGLRINAEIICQQPPFLKFCFIIVPIMYPIPRPSAKTKGV